MPATEKMDIEQPAAQKTPTELAAAEKKARRPIQTVQYNLELLESAKNAKDTKIGIRVVKDIKYLRRAASPALLKHLWTALAQDVEMPSLVAAAGTPEFQVEVKDKYVGHPYTKIYVLALTLSYLLKNEAGHDEISRLGESLISSIKEVKSWYLDNLWSYVYYLYARGQEKAGKLHLSRGLFFELYRQACVTRCDSSQAMLLNLILRCFMTEHDFRGASEFVSHTLFPENKINNEFIKYLYYTSKIKAIELNYKEAFARVTQALRKAPEGAALGFRVQAQKLSVVVEMLMGDVPARTTFVEGELASHLFAYYSLVKSLVKGEVKAFEAVVAKHRSEFEKDGLLVLVNRLTLNVVRAGLRRINLSYSCISFVNICEKLGLPQDADIESMVAKAIRDGVINGRVDFAQKLLHIKEEADLYSTREPQINFQKRIDYCTNLITTCSKAMLYKDEEKKGAAESEDIDEIDIEELIEEFAEDDLL